VFAIADRVYGPLLEAMAAEGVANCEYNRRVHAYFREHGGTVAAIACTVGIGKPDGGDDGK
jgi:hypothetical protein